MKNVKKKRRERERERERTRRGLEKTNRKKSKSVKAGS